MTDKIENGGSPAGARVFHLPPRRERSRSLEERVKHEVENVVAAQFREQNELLRASNKDLSDRLQRLTNGVELLVAEMQGVRTGKKEEAFARIAGLDCDPDLPTVCAEAALYYTLTAADIGERLGFHSSQIGLLLGPKGIGWAGNGDYQEISRNKRPSASKFWHFEVPDRLIKVLDENDPAKHGVRNKAVLAIFRRWHEKKAQGSFLTLS
jgi:hypothetical protein